jgi:hypothetical protein
MTGEWLGLADWACQVSPGEWLWPFSFISVSVFLLLI